jgi:hypothetical protein
MQTDLFLIPLVDSSLELSLTSFTPEPIFVSPFIPVAKTTIIKEVGKCPHRKT